MATLAALKITTAEFLTRGKQTSTVTAERDVKNFVEDMDIDMLELRPEQNVFVEMRLGLRFQLVTVITNVKVNPRNSAVATGGFLYMTLGVDCANGPCLNGATCVEIFTDVYRCICTDEWTGTYCENKKPKTTVNSLSTTTTKITTSTAFYKKTSTASGKSTDGSSREYRTNVTDSTYINPTDSGNNGMIAVYVLVPLIAITLAILFAVFISRKSTLKCLRTLDVEQESNQNASNYYENTKHYRQLGTERSQQSDTEYKGSRDGQRIKIESSGVTYYNTVDGTKGFEVQRNYENVKNSWMSIGGESRNKTEAHCESSSNTASLQCYESLRKDTQDKDNSYDCLKIKK
ncbi:uncharacterized protein LOC123551753 isoform X2 [Mercenaria mercenaria]|uniref:uncharacterized protein LOC123551753 isoform X2 n=1 Tax=Mercenaria mercenaria TaxID=6596 RepID=UPI00234F7914|nr:uncharacterized protein LOC123551753 isoform X2 [Mercenaria mercenaria]